MDCPSCAQEMISEIIGGSEVYHCPACGWGRDRALQLRIEAEGGAPPVRDISPRTWIKLPVFWALSLVIVFGPYFLLLYGVPAGLQAFMPIEKPADPARMRDLLNPAYWIWLGVYLMCALAFTPEADTEDLGWAGGFIDNPFTFEDDRNREMLGLGLILAPGKIVIFTLRGTFRVFRHLLFGR